MIDDYSSVIDEQIRYISMPVIYCADFLYNLVKPKSVIDFGCGPGLYSLVFMGKGCKVKGIDGCDRGGKLIPTTFELYDFQKYYKSKRKYDLALCIEVAEHLYEPYANVLIDSLVDSSDVIFFTAAQPEQGGYCHHNEQPFQYWIDKFIERNFNIDKNLTSNMLNELNKNIYNIVPWLRNSAIFRRII